MSELKPCPKYEKDFFRMPLPEPPKEDADANK